MPQILLISLGCAKNLVDSERLAAGVIEAFGFSITDSPKAADLILINTCAFIEPAVEEAINVILTTAAQKNKTAKIVVLGCLPSRFGTTLSPELPEVDLFLPPARYPDLENLIAKLMDFPLPKKIKAAWPHGPRLLSTPFFRAYLKIAEGCRNGCNFCLIPSIRGPLKSQPQEVLLKEARELIAGGVKELTLIAQDTTAYGQDLSPENGGLAELTAQITQIPGLEWLRLMYAYPQGLTDDLVKALAANPKVAPYVDIPLQHVSPSILKRMGRVKQPPALKFVKRLRKLWPGLSIRTTLMVGFPGETEDNFNELLEFVNEANLDHLGVFKFLPEDGSPAAVYPGQVAKIIKEKRRRQLMAAQRKVALKLAKAKKGRVYPILVEGPSEDSELIMVGRAPFQAPEVDGLVYFSGLQPLLGEIVTARIVKNASPYDFVAEMNDE